MRKTRLAGALAGIAIAALGLTACNSGTPGAETTPSDDGGVWPDSCHFWSGESFGAL